MAKNNPKTKPLDPTMAHIPTKSANGKPVTKRSPTEVNKALLNRYLPKDNILAICALAESLTLHESRINKTNKIHRPNTPSPFTVPSPLSSL